MSSAWPSRALARPVPCASTPVLGGADAARFPDRRARVPEPHARDRRDRSAPSRRRHHRGSGTRRRRQLHDPIAPVPSATLETTAPRATPSSGPGLRLRRPPLAPSAEPTMTFERARTAPPLEEGRASAPPSRLPPQPPPQVLGFSRQHTQAHRRHPGGSRSAPSPPVAPATLERTEQGGRREGARGARWGSKDARRSGTAARAGAGRVRARSRRHAGSRRRRGRRAVRARHRL